MRVQSTNDTEHSSDLTKRVGWVVFLTATSVLFTLALACAAPFAAIGAAAALFLQRRDAIWLTAITWLANQAVGFGFAHYPLDAQTFMWGGLLGISAFAATGAAMAADRVTRNWDRAFAAVLAFIAAFIAYEGFLYLVTQIVSPEPGDYAVKTVVMFLEINGCAFAGLILLQKIGSVLGLVVPRNHSLGTPVAA
ncbi:MAG TPA: hypothetical protein VK779_05980 [Rhizomicrobium sp.]|nr:hypothetical protein [Rhizomicrobium sp.]